MPADGDFREGFVGGRGFREEGSSGVEAVDEEGGAACAGGVREEVEHLQAGWVREICVVGVRGEGEVGVGGVFHSEVCCEVVEAAWIREHIFLLIFWEMSLP